MTPHLHDHGDHAGAVPLHQRITFRFACFVAVAVVISTLTVGLFVLDQFEDALVDEELQSLDSVARAVATRLEDEMQHVRGDVRFLERTPPVPGLIRTHLSGGIDPADGSTDQLWRERLAVIFTQMLRAKPHYLQVRYIGLHDDGRELVRVDRVDDAIVTCPPDALQNKGHRSYVTEAVSRGPGSVYFSPAELNREHGRIQVPHIPVTRAAIPVYAPDGTAFGVIVINVDLRETFDDLRARLDGDEVLRVANVDGEYILHPEPGQAFAFDHGASSTLAAEFGDGVRDAWMLDSEEHRVLTTERANVPMALALRGVAIDPQHPELAMTVAVSVPLAGLHATSASIRAQCLLVGGVLLVGLLSLGAWLSRRWSQPIARITETIERVARGEPAHALPTERPDEVGRLARRFAELLRLQRMHSDALDLVAEVYECDADGRIVYVNERFCEAVGMPRDGVLGRDHRDFAVGEGSLARFEEMASVTADDDIWRGEVECRGASGRSYWVDMVFIPIDRDDDGQLTRALAIRSVATARKEAEAELLRQHATELEQKNEELEQFAYVASHDLQEPLRMVSSYMSLLEARYGEQLDDDALEFISFAVDGAARMKQLILDLLTYSRVGKGEVRRERVELDVVISDVLHDLGLATEEAAASITIDALPAVHGDPGQLRQLLQNLIGNALKYRSEDRPTEIAITGSSEGGHCHLIVRDNGIGIDPEFAERIFVIFQRLHGRESYSGTGIGLAICRKIVERSGGRIWVESDGSTGSVFHITLPLAAREEVPHACAA